jgi:sulfate adenylyltransferase subunit 1 (EFTu-like GTPase family)
MTTQTIAELVKKFWLPLIVVLIGALAIAASHYKRAARNEAERADAAEQQVNAAQAITANILTSMTIFNSIAEANQHAKEQIALDASGAAADIKVAVANDDCANRTVPAGAVKRLQQFANGLRQSAGGPVTAQPDG